MKSKFFASILSATTLLLSSAYAEEIVDTNIKIWPRISVVSLPTNLEQFMFIETPNQPISGEFSMQITLPEGIEVKGFFSGSSPAVPPGDISMLPTDWDQDGNVVTANFSGDIFPNQEKAWLSTDIMVTAPVGDYDMNISLIQNDKIFQSNDFKVKVYPELVNQTSDNFPIVAWYYTGLDKEYVPAFMEQFIAAGVNGFYSMEGERVWRQGEVATDTVADYAPKYGTQQGIVFFSKWALEYAKNIELPAEFQGLELTLQSFIDNPELGKWAIKSYLDYVMGGKEHQVIIYDAEAGCFGRDGLEGDLTKYSLAKFSKEVGATHTLTAEEIFADYQDEWMWYNCRQTNSIAQLTRDVIDENYPDKLMKVYSGFEYDFEPNKNLSRRNYSMDWNSLSSEVFFDYAGAGYYGNPAQLNHTYEVISNNGVTFIPAEMYVENFLTENIGDLTPERFGLRLIKTFLNSGMRGMSLWYAADMDGGALIAVSELTKFMLAIEDYALNGTIDHEAVEVQPKAETENVYVIKDTRQAMVVLLNDTNKVKRIRLTLNGFKIHGYTSDLQITNMKTGEVIPANKIITVTVEPNSYTLLHLLDDGN